MIIALVSIVLGVDTDTVALGAHCPFRSQWSRVVASSVLNDSQLDE